MRPKFVATSGLPDGVVVAVVPGRGEASVLIDQDAPGWKIAAALQECIPDWVREEWLYVGPCTSMDADLRRAV